MKEENDTIETAENLMNLSDIARYVDATIYSVQKALDALGYKPIRKTRNRTAMFYPESVKYEVKQWLKDN